MTLHRTTLCEQKPIPKSYILHDSIYIYNILEVTKFLKWRKMSYCQGLRREKKWWWERNGCGHETALWGSFAVMQMLCVLMVSMSISWLWYGTIVCNMLPLQLGKEYTGSLCTFSYNCMQIHNYLKLKA